MADRFPSLEEFDSGGQAETPSADASAHDFIAREQAALGADAEQFAEIDEFASGKTDFLGRVDATQSSFESQFPDLASPSAGPSALPGNSLITSRHFNDSSKLQTHADNEEESQVIREWRQRRDELIAKRVDQYATQREDTIKIAQQNIDDFYENYNAKKEKGIAMTRKDEEQFLTNQDDSVSGETSWARVAKLVDLSGKGIKGGAAGSGKERFREILASIRKDGKAPSAAEF